MKPQTLRTSFRLLCSLFLLLLALAPSALAATYYSQGSVTPNTLANWNTVRAGGGSAPANFTAGDTFVVQNGHNMTNTAAWAVTGTGNKIQIESGGLLMANSTFIISCTAFQIDNGGTYIHNAGNSANASANDIPGTTRSFGASSTVEIRKWGDGTGTSPNALPSGISWGNLIINVGTLAGSWNQSGGISTINGNFTIKATGGGTFEFRLSSTTLYTLTIGGDLTIQGGILSGYSNTGMADGCAINLYGNYSQSAGTTFKTTSITSGGLLTFTFDSTGGPAAVNFTQAGTFSVNRIRFVIGAGKTVTLNSAFAAGSGTPIGSVNVNGTLLCNGFNVTGADAFTNAPGGTLGITSAAGITSTAATGNIQVTGARSFDTNANYIYYGSAASAVTGNQLPATVNNLTINNANGVTLSQNVQVNGTMTMTAGGVTLGGNTLSYGASGTLLYNGASSQTTAAAEFPASGGPANLTITNGSGVILNFARNIAGTLSLTNGTLTTTAANLLTIGSSGNTAGGSASSYVNGPLARVYGGTGSKNFPSGVGSFRQVAVNLTGISGTPTITVTPNEPSAWNGANTPASTTMFGTRDWTMNSSGAGNTASITVDGTGFSPSGAARIEVFDGSATTAFTPTFASPNYTATGIALASGNNEVALGDLACSAPTTPTFASVPSTSCGQVSVFWNSASGATTYDLFRKVSGGSYPATPLAAGLTATNYLDSDVTNAVTYIYQVKAYSACGASSLSADSAGATATTAPFITANPVSYVSYDGFAATFTVGARGDGLTYQWQINNGGGFVNVTGADGTGGTTATFTTVNATTNMNNYQYRCVVNGTCSPAATTTVATLTLGTQFRSLASGAWATNTSWQISADGSTWVNAPLGVYPGATAGHTDPVQVRAAHNVILATNAVATAGSLTIDATGKVSIGDQLSATDGNTTLQISGSLTNNGTITAGQGNNNLIVFNGTTTWVGSGDITCGGFGKLGFTVNTGATLNLAVDVALRTATGQARVTVNGTLNAGTRIIKQASGSTTANSAFFVVGPGATVETANPGGLGGTTNIVSGLFQAVTGNLSLDSAANYIFDGITNQTANFGPGLPLLTAANNITIRNTGLVTSNTVTVGSLAISGVLYVQNGLVSFGSTTTSTAGALTFDGSTYQTTGTWGNVGSAASNTDATHFAGTGYVTVSGPIAVTSTTQFRSHISGNWNAAGTWEGSADGGATWSALLTGFTPGSTPGSTHKVYVQASHVVTLTEDEACNDLNMSIGTTSSTTGGGGGKIACVTNALSVNGQLRGYWAPVSTTPGTDQPSGSAFDPFTKTDNGGRIKFVGSGRVILAASQWGSYNIASLPLSPGGAADWEFALTPGQTATNLSSFRPANIVIDSGTTLDIGTSIIGACGNGGQGVGTGGAGNITISNGATLISAGTGVISRRTSTASSGAIGTFANQGTLKLSGAAPMIAAAVYDFSGGTVEYNGGSQTLLVKDSGTTGPQTDPTNYNAVILSGTGTKTTPANIAATGTLTVSSGVNLDVNSKTITLAGAPTLNGTLSMLVSRTGANTFTGSQIVQTSGTFAYGGALSVTNTGSAVAPGESIPLINSTGGYSGSFGSVALSPLASGLAASVSSGNLNIACDGTLSASAAANASICLGGSYFLGGSATGGGGGYTYSWTSTPPGFTSSSANPSVSPTATTTYNLTVTDANGCTSPASVTVTVNPLPTTSAITGTNSVQQLSSATYSVVNTPGSTYGWTVPAGASFTGGAGNSINVTFGSTSGNVAVVETNSTGCTGTQQTLAVTVITCSSPVIVGGIDPGVTNVNAFNPVVFALTNFTGTAPITYQWRTNGVDIAGATNSSYTNLSVKVADAGNYQVVLANGCGAITSSIAVLTVSKATPTATLAVNNSPQTYDGTGKSATVAISVSSVPGTVANILTGGASSQTNAGTYAVTADFVPTDTANYDTLTAQSAGNFVIQQVAASVTADAKTKTYGAVNPTLTATVVGTVNGDILNYTLATDAAQFSSVGVSNITVTLGSNPNYNVLATNNTLTIGAKAASITANNASKVLGQTLTFAGTEFTTSGFVGGDSVTSVSLSSSGAVNTAAVGSYAIVASGATGSGLGNYTISYTNGTLTVNAATPVVINSPIQLLDGNFQLTFTGGDAGVSYVIQAASDLSNPIWLNLITNTATMGGLPSYSDLKATNYPIRFYRTVAP